MKTFSISDVGKTREMNEDYVFTAENSVGNLPNLFIVADGMGGHRAGEFASRYTVETIVRMIGQDRGTEPVQIIQNAIRAANEELLKKAEEDAGMAGMGTTVVVMTVIGTKACVANVGDSRMYVIGEKITQITQDHSLVEEMVRMGEITKEAAKDHPDKHIITRAIGVADEVTADLFEVDLCDQDYILMCSDGLTNMVEDEDIKKIVNSQRDVAERAERLVEAANSNGGKDNITVVVIEPFR